MYSSSFVYYYRSEKDGVLGHESFCFVSECLRHTTAMVYTFLQDLIPHIKINYPQVKKIIYFSDGCAGQCKNRYNFINLLHHEEDFDLQAEWNFFATSHGKNACDGIGGTLKRSVARTSLQRPLENQILTPLDFFNYCNKNMKHITMFYTPTKEVENSKEFLTPRFARTHTIQRTQKYHRFVPINKKSMQVFQVSKSSSKKNSRIVRLVRREKEVENEISLTTDDIVGSYVCVKEGGKVWVAHVDSFDKKFEDFFVCFLHTSGMQKMYWFPQDEHEQCFKTREQILGVLPHPKLIG